MYSKTIIGNLLDSNAQYIAHQCNCISTGSAGLAKAIFSKFPYSDVYTDRKEDDILGEIKICGNGKDQRYVINMFSQYYPGICKYPGGKDSSEMREKAFQKCLNKISKIKGIRSIAFPHTIGCGLAGGLWANYEKMIENFACDNFLIDVYVVELL